MRTDDETTTKELRKILYNGSDYHCIDIRTYSVHFYSGRLAMDSYDYNVLRQVVNIE